MDLETKALEYVTHSYLNSHDFNGVSFEALSREMHISADQLREALTTLLEKGQTSIVADVNPYIKRFPEEPITKQKSRLDSDEGLICIYPSPVHLKKVVDQHAFDADRSL